MEQQKRPRSNGRRERSASTSRVEMHIEWPTRHAKLGVRHACLEDEGAMLVTSVWQLKKITCSTQCPLLRVHWRK